MICIKNMDLPDEFHAGYQCYCNQSLPYSIQLGYFKPITGQSMNMFNEYMQFGVYLTLMSFNIVLLSKYFQRLATYGWK